MAGSTKDWTATANQTSGIASPDDIAASAGDVTNEVNNITINATWLSIDIEFTQNASHVEGEPIYIYIQYAIDGTNYPEPLHGGTLSTFDGAGFTPDAIMTTMGDVSSEAPELFQKNVTLPIKPYKLKVVIFNGTAQQMDDVTVLLRTFNDHFTTD